MADKSLKPIDLVSLSNAPATPGSGFVRVYGKTDGKVYAKNDSGTEYDLTPDGAVPQPLSTSDNPQFASVNVGHASDTTITRSASGVIAVEGVVIPSVSSTNTFTNKRITKRITSETSSATPTINTDNCDIHKITALAINITSMTTNLSGTPTDGQALIIQITGTAARTITWGTSFESSTVTLPSTTVTTARLDVGFLFNSSTSKWRCVAVA